MPTATIGQPSTFHVLFLDASNLPIIVTAPTIKVFRFSPSGSEVVLTTAPMSAVVGDLGRFQYTLTIPTYLSPGDVVYATMQGTDPFTSQLLIVEDQFSLVAPSTAGAIVARFIR